MLSNALRTRSGPLSLMVTLCAVVLVGCGAKTSPSVDTSPPATSTAAPSPAAEPAADATAAAPLSTATPPSAPAAPMAPATAMTDDALDELLAPVALYPDALLVQILAASSHPQEVMDGGNWLIANPELKGDALQSQATQAGFGPSLLALMQFPTVIDMMCQQFDWTQQLGSAVNADQARVLAAVQRLRAQAQKVGNLKSTPEQKVERKTINEQQVIVVQPADPKIVYVPQYNPQTVYTTPAPAPAVQSGPSTGDVIAAGVFGFAAGVLLTKIFDNNDDYPSANWGYGGMYYGGRPYSTHVYVYRPNYNHGYRPGYRPGYGYRPPPNYPNAWNRPQHWRSGNPAAIGPSQSNYFNQFHGNQNQASGRPRPPLVSPEIGRQPGAYRPAPRPTPPMPGAAAQNTWKGRTDYQGARPGGSGPPAAPALGRPARPAGTERPAVGGARPAIGRPAPDRGQTMAGGQTRPAPRPAMSRPAPSRPTVDRGYGDLGHTFGGGRPATVPGRPDLSRPSPTATPSARPEFARPSPAPSAMARPAPAVGPMARPAPSANPMARPAPAPTPMARPALTGGRGTAFDGARGRPGAGDTSGRAERAAAARGRQSLGAGGARPMPNH